jgi:hypothetical protein
VHRSTLTSTLAGNAVDCLTITAPSASAEVQKKKKGAVITGTLLVCVKLYTNYISALSLRAWAEVQRKNQGQSSQVRN